MTSRGRVRQYSTKEGWGIIDSVDTPGGCLIQILSIHTPTGTLTAGEEVDFEWVPLPAGVEEELFKYAALSARPAGAPHHPPPARKDDHPGFIGGAWTWKSPKTD
ncbi:cold shock domain-containing protein (plasmid) [Rhodococcoides fascians A21d2]|uniref:cold shock domain-containing protein n=1 Tax=Rhodococcoides fascians TaxID=1828 RepID=UPI0012D2C501|nr:cold shock domain-containing protein [Rhodococcus fascians]QII03733.1 cold shock domain-containing protein [Rhodococcus fascians A21d2]